MVHLPMEPQDTGGRPGTIRPDDLTGPASPPNIDRNLTAIDGYIGVNNHMGSKFSAWEPGMRAVMAEDAPPFLIYLDSLTTPDTAAKDLAAGR